MLAPLLVFALGAAAPARVALVPVVRPALITAPEAARIARQVRRALERDVAFAAPAEVSAALEGEDPARCEDDRACFARLGRKAGAWAVVRLEAAEVAGSLTVVLQAIDTASAEELAEAHFTVATAEFENEAPARLAALAAKLAASAPPPPVSDAPVVAQAEPASPPASALVPARAAPPAPALVERPRARRGPLAPVLAGAGAAAFAGAAAGFFAWGLDARACLNGAPAHGQPTVCVPQGQVQAKQAQADAGLVVGSVASAFATGLAATALVLLLTD